MNMLSIMSTIKDTHLQSISYPDSLNIKSQTQTIDILCHNIKIVINDRKKFF